MCITCSCISHLLFSFEVRQICYNAGTKAYYKPCSINTLCSQLCHRLHKAKKSRPCAIHHTSKPRHHPYPPLSTHTYPSLPTYAPTPGRDTFDSPNSPTSPDAPLQPPISNDQDRPPASRGPPNQTKSGPDPFLRRPPQSAAERREPARRLRYSIPTPDVYDAEARGGHVRPMSARRDFDRLVISCWGLAELGNELCVLARFFVLVGFVFFKG